MPTLASMMRVVNAIRDRPRATTALPAGTPAPKPIEYAVQASSAVTVIVADPSVSRSVNGWRSRIAAVPYAAAISPTVAMASGTAGEKRRAAFA